MDSNRTKALTLWSGMDTFWNLVENKEEINNLWQTMYASVEQVEKLYDAYGRLSVINMPTEFTLTNVVLSIYATSGSKKYVTFADALLGTETLTDIVSIPKLRTVINEDTEYVEGVDYNLVVEGSELAIEWTGDVPDEDEDFPAYYAPEVLIINVRLDQFGDMHWDMQLREAGLDAETRKHIYHSLMITGRIYPTRSSLENSLNIIAGSDYAQYAGKIIKTGTTIGALYVMPLYLMRHAGVVYGSETETAEIDIDIEGNLMTGIAGTANIGDIIKIDEIEVSVLEVTEANEATINASLVHGTYRMSADGGLTFVNARVKGNKVTGAPRILSTGDSLLLQNVTAMVASIDTDNSIYLLDIQVPDSQYDISIYNAVTLTFNDCYAAREDNIYSCLYDTLPDSGPYDVSNVQNYDITSGNFLVISEQFDCGPGASILEDGDYVGIYTPINPSVVIYDWKRIGDTGTEDPNYAFDDYIIKNYLQDTGMCYLPGGTLSEHDLVPGDTLIMDIGYHMEYPATSPDTYTIVVPGSPTGVLDMYGNATDPVINFDELEQLVITDGTPDGERCNVTVLSGEYDDIADEFTLTTIEEITVASVAAVWQSFHSRHKHVILTVSPDYEITTDRTEIYGEYGTDCSIIARRCKDLNYRTHIFEIADASLNPEETLCTITVTGDRDLDSDTPPIEGSTTAIVWSDQVNVTHFQVSTLDTNEIVVEWDVHNGLDVHDLIGATILYAGGLYSRAEVHITSTNHDADILEILAKVAGYMLPDDTTITTHAV